LRSISFLHFAEEFIFEFSEKSHKNSPTEGHPSEVIVKVAQILVDFVQTESSSGEIFRPLVKNVFIEADRSHILFFEAHSSPPLDIGDTIEDFVLTNRATLLHAIFLMSILLHWPHNRLITIYHFQGKFIETIITMMKFFSEKIDDLCSSWQPIRRSPVNLEDIISSDLLNDTTFVIHCVLALTQLLSRSCPNVEDISFSTSIGFLPRQPWSQISFDRMGVNLLSTHHRDPRVERFSFDFPISEPAFIPSMRPIQFHPESELWSQFLLDLAVDTIVTKLLQKIVHVTQVLSPISETDSENLQWEGIMRAQHQECIILQIEVLFCLLSLMAIDQGVCCPHFFENQGAAILTTIILQICSGPRRGSLYRNLCYQAGVFCLRFNEISNQWLTWNSQASQSIHLCTDRVFLPSSTICSFLLWTKKNFSYQEEYLAQISGAQSSWNTDDVKRSQSCGLDVIVGAVQSDELQLANGFRSDLWPWISDPLRRDNVSAPATMYRLCHPCSEQDLMDESTISIDQNCPNLLKIWSQFFDKCVDPSSSQTESTSNYPWFLKGSSALSFQIIFGILFSTCLGKGDSFFLEVKQSSEIKRCHIVTNFISIMQALLSVLSESPQDHQIPGTLTIPLFETHILLFLARCLDAAPVHIIEACCEAPEIWSTIFSSKFFLGGRNEIQNFTRLNLQSHTDQEIQLPNGFSFLNPILSCSSRSGLISDFCSDSLTEIMGYTWVFVHDFSLDLASIITSVVNHPPANRIVTIKRNFDIKPIIHALQESSENGDDSVTFQLLKWMSGYLDLLSTRGSSIRNSLSGQFFRAALAVCGYHLGDIRASAILQKEHPIDPILVANQSRPFLWVSRRAAIELVIQVLGYPGCDRWLRLFSNAKSEKPSVGIEGPNSLIRSTKSPAHVTLMLLFVDVRLRQALCFILTKVLFKLMTETTSSDSSIFDDDRGKNCKDSNDLSLDESKLTPKAIEGGNRLYDNCIRDLLVDLFELIKWSSRQPEWYNGSEVAVSILESLTQMLRSSMRNDLQKWFRRGGILSEMIVCLNSCLQHSDKWAEEIRVQIIHHGLACLTAIMSGEPKNKAEFRMIMMSKKPNRSLSSQSSGRSTPIKLKKSSQVGIRYDDFIEMILRAQKSISICTFLILFEMLLDGPISTSKVVFENFQKCSQLPITGLFSDPNDRPHICNLAIIPLIFGVLRQSITCIQEFVLNSFYSLINGRGSLINISNCSQMNPSLLDIVLDYFPYQVESVQLVSVKLLQSLGKHSVSVAQLKRIFQMMRSHDDFRPSYSTLLLKGLLGMVEENERPRYSFVFDGLQSGIEIPSIFRWPAQTAFTLSLWIHLESPQLMNERTSHGGKQNGNEYRPFIVSMRCCNGNGFEIFLRRSSTSNTKFRACIRSFGGVMEGESFHLPQKLTLVEGRWHYLAVSLKSSSFRNHSEIEVMLDDQFVRHKLSFPKFNDVIEKPLLGNCLERFRENNVNTALQGQMSAFYLFADALTEGQLRGIYGLGPSYFYSFESYSIVHRDIPSNTRKQTVDPVLSILDGSLSSLIILAYNPAVWKGDYYLDNTPERNQVRWRQPTNLSLPHNLDTEHQWDSYLSTHNPGKMHAKSLPGTHRSTTSDIRTALNSLGGVRVLLPLFVQCDQPRVKNVVDDWKGSSGDLELITTVDIDISSTLLDLLRCFLVKSSENDVLLRDFQGFALIGFFFERMSPQHLTLQTLDLLIKIRDSVSWNPSFSDDVLEYLLLNFKIWKFASFEVQKQLFFEIDCILSNLDSKTIQSRNFTIKIMDALYLLYDYQNPPLDLAIFKATESHPRTSDSTSGSLTGDTFFSGVSDESIYLADRWVHASSGHVEGVKLMGSELTIIRSSILRILVKIIERGHGDNMIISTDISSLVHCALLSSHSISKAEILSLLIYFLRDHNTTNLPRVISGLISAKGFSPLLPLVSDPHVHVRLIVLLIFCNCLRQGAVYDSLINQTRHEAEVISDGLETEGHSIDPSLHFEVRRSDVDAAEGMDTLSMLGLPIPALVGITNYFQLEIMHSLTSEAFSADDINSQGELILQALLSTLLGESCSHLFLSVLKLKTDDQILPLDLDFFYFSLSALEKSSVRGAHLNESTLCIPMVLPAILSILRQQKISIALRLSTMVDLRTYILQDSDNCDCILRIPAWQDYFFQLIVEETLNSNLFEQPTSTPDPAQSRYLIKSKALVDTCLRTLCDIQFTAVRIGKPTAPSVIVSPYSKRNSLLTVDRIFQETKLGERRLGVTVLRETMSFLRLYHREGIGEVDIYPIAFDLLQQTVSALQRESDILLSPKKLSSLNEDGDEDLKLYFQNMLFLNIWLVGAIVLEFLTFPLGVGTCIQSNGPLLGSSFHSSSTDSISLKVYQTSVWSLVESLLRLMGPLGPMNNTQLLIGYDEKGYTANQVGYLSGQKSSTLVDERIHEIVSKPEKNIHSSGLDLTSKNRTPLFQAAGGVCWIMVRLLFSVFAHGGVVENSMALSALSELKALIAFMCDQNLENFGFELKSIIARLTAVLFETTLSIQAEWVKGALNLLIDLILIQRTDLMSLLSGHEKGSRNPNLRRNGQTDNGTATYQTNAGLVFFFKLMEKYSEKPESSYQMTDILVDVVRTCLGFSDDFPLTWGMWSSLMAAVVEEANFIENELRREKLTDIGLHKHSEEVRAQLEHLKTIDNQVFQKVLNQASITHATVRELKLKSLSEQLRSMSIDERKIKLRWNQILYQLTNERGPWGFADDAMEVFWTLDETESNFRMTHVLRRNEVGTSHKVAALLSQRGKQVTSQNNLESEDSPVGATKQYGSRVGCSNTYVSHQGLWRDLMKYQKKSSILAESPMDPSDRIELEEEDEEVKETDSRKILFRASVEVIMKSTNSSGGSTYGILELSKHKLSFTRSSEESSNFVNKTGNTEFLWACESFPTTTWHTNEVYNLYFRKYQMRDVALEIFFTSRQVVFFNLFDPKNQRELYDTLRRRCRPPFLQPHYGYQSRSIVANALHQLSSRTMTQAWINRNISNFEYLMFLNTVAGRSFNDMSQYPVFPWIIADYTSPKLNLTEPKTFRDLRWPMGAQQESQREAFTQRYQDLAESYEQALEEKKISSDANGSSVQIDCLPPFHYGSHYSTMGFVLWYLIREEPFTSLNVWMQDGKFDKPDRIFDTIEACWRGCTSNQADVKELIPEFFYNADFLENTNRLNLGITSSNKVLGPVGLPQWAKNPQDFIRQNRNALESEYVSANLHHWIDLIFGYKQRPPHMGGTEAAVDACNVYFHLTYSGAVDLDDLKLNDTRLYNQMVRQIDNYGQTPTELFNRPHPMRKSLDEVDLFWPIASHVLGVDTLPRSAKLPERPRRMVCFKEQKVSIWPIVFIGEINTWEKMITVDSSRIIATHLWQIRPPDVVPPFQFRLDLHALKSSQGSTLGGFDMSTLRYNSTSKERVGVPFAPEQLLRSDFISESSNRKIKILANSKLIYEKEEAGRSNWKIRAHVQSPSNSKKSPESKMTPRKTELREQDFQTPNLANADSSPFISRVDEHISSHLFALLPDHRLLFSCGHWDNSFKVTLIDSGRLLQSISQHRDVVTCLALAIDYGQIWLVTGSRDCTLIIWEINPLLEKPIIQPPMHVLYGHDDSVNCVSVNPELDLVVSGSDDGTIIVHKLREGMYLRSIPIMPSISQRNPTSPTEQSVNNSNWSYSRSFMLSRRIHFVLVSSDGFIVAYSNDDSTLYSFAINGKFQAKKMIGDRLHAVCLSEDHKVIITGGERGLLVLRLVHSLELSHVGSKLEFDSIIDGRSQDDNDQKPFASPIRSIYFTKQERHLIVGLENGEIRILAQV
jgi:WD40 repeat protein